MRVKVVYGDTTLIWNYPKQKKLFALQKFVTASLKITDYMISWKDDEDDNITILEEADIDSALNIATEDGRRYLKLYIMRPLNVDIHHPIYLQSQQVSTQQTQSQIYPNQEIESEKNKDIIAPLHRRRNKRKKQENNIKDDTHNNNNNVYNDNMNNNNNNSNNTNDNIYNDPPQKKRKLSAFDTIMKKQYIKKSKKKKVIKSKKKQTKMYDDTTQKIIEQKYLKLDEQQRLMLINNIDNDHFNTMSVSLGFENDEINILSEKLRAYLLAMNNASKMDIKLAFKLTAPNISCRAIKQNWKCGSNSFKLIQKRLLLLKLNRSGIDKKQWSNITTTQMRVTAKIMEIKNSLQTKTIKRQNNKILSINDVIKQISESNNKWRETNKLCDDILVIQCQLKDKMILLNELENDIDELLQFDMKIMTKTNGIRENVMKKTTFDITPKYKAPDIYHIFMNILNNINLFKSELQSKLNMIKNIKVQSSTIKDRSDAMKEARVNDKNRKNKREEIEKKQNEPEIIEYTYNNNALPSDDGHESEEKQSDIQERGMWNDVSKQQREHLQSKQQQTVDSDTLEVQDNIAHTDDDEDDDLVLKEIHETLK